MNQSKAEIDMMHNIIILDAAARTYYAEGEEPALSDAEYDKILAELIQLEETTGIRLPNSPTVRVGFPESADDKVKHYTPILSLKDTKSVDEMLNFSREESNAVSNRSISKKMSDMRSRYSRV